MELFQIVGDYGNDFHAGPKAQRDVTAILEREGWKSFVVKRPTFGNGFAGRIFARLVWAVECRRLKSKLPGDCAIFMQYPSAAWSESRALRVVTAGAKARKKFKLIVLVHDLNDFRDGKRRLTTDERALLEMADAVILHNERMVEAVAGCGILREKLIALQCFDYLTGGDDLQSRERCGADIPTTVNVAGNLNVERSGWLREIGAIPGLRWHLFGPYYDPVKLCSDNFTYGGCRPPEELPRYLTDGFGCVWYGESASTCTGKIVDYLRFINPHKLSLYLAAGLPVVVWSESAVADFVVRNKVGLAVRSLVELPERIVNMTAEEYAAMAQNARELGRSVLRGEFTRKAIATALRRIDL